MRLSIILLIIILLLSGMIWIASPESIMAFDLSIQVRISAYRSAAMTRIIKAITFFGSQYFLLPAYLLLIGFYIHKEKKKSAQNVFVIGSASTILLFLLKQGIQRQRPAAPLIQGVQGFSFPSGHAFSSFLFFGLLIYMIYKSNIQRYLKILLTTILFIFSWMIGYSRVYLRVHYASDVLAAFVLSILCLIISLLFITYLRNKPKNILSLPNQK